MYREMGASNAHQNRENCPVCDAPANVQHRPDESLYTCGVCGKYLLWESAARYLTGIIPHKANLYKVSYAFRTKSERAFLVGEINPQLPGYKDADIIAMMSKPDPPVQEKLHMLLRFMGQLTKFPGETLEFDNSHDYSIVCAKNPDEAEFYLRSLGDQGLLKLEQPYTGSAIHRFAITAEGWKEIDRIESLGVQSSRVFVAMSFSADMKTVYENAIKPAIENAGYHPYRADAHEHTDNIDDVIISQMRASRFMVADFTGQKGGVYFEAGFMKGLGRRVIWLCRKPDFSKVHFDNSHYNFIVYATVEELKERLTNRIAATEGQGPLVVS